MNFLLLHCIVSMIVGDCDDFFSLAIIARLHQSEANDPVRVIERHEKAFKGFHDGEFVVCEDERWKGN